MIAFVSNRDGNSEIYIMDSDGRNQRKMIELIGYILLRQKKLQEELERKKRKKVLLPFILSSLPSILPTF